MKKRIILLTLGFLAIAFECLSSVITPSFSVSPPYVLTSGSIYANRVGGGGGGYGFMNESGQYLLESGIVPGNYTVEASVNGYINAKVNTTVNSVSDVNTVDLTLNRSAVVRGKVLGFDGAPVVGAEVSLTKQGSYFPLGQTTSDSNGMYYFASNIDTGNYYVNVTFSFPFEVAAYSVMYGNNYTGLPTYSYLDAPYLASGYVERGSGLFSVTAGQTTAVSDLVLERSGVITGIVKDEMGTPIPYAAVAAEWLGDITGIVLADLSGTYKIAYDVLNRSYNVRPYAYGYIGNETVVVANQTGTVWQNFTMSRSAEVHGHVWREGDNRPVSGVQLTFLGPPPYYQGITTESDGAYSISGGLGPGDYFVSASLGYATVNYTSITLSAGESKLLDFWIDAYFISGTVHENSTSGPGVSFAGVDLEFVADPYPTGGYTIANEDGSYELALPIEEGMNGLTVSANFTVTAWDYNTTRVNMDVVIGEDVTGLDFVLYPSPTQPPPESAKITGTVYGNSGPSLPFSYQWWHLTSGNYSYMVGVNSSSCVMFVSGVISNTGDLMVVAWGPEGTDGRMTVWIPHPLYQEPFTVTSSIGPDPLVESETFNGTHTIITITYGHSYKFMTFHTDHVIPEFPTQPIIAIALIASAAMILLEKKRKMSKII